MSLTSLLSQIFFCLLVSFLIGLFTGWMMGKSGIQAAIERLRAEWERRVHGAETERDEALSAHRRAEGRFATLASEGQSLRERLASTEGELKSAQSDAETRINNLHSLQREEAQRLQKAGDELKSQIAALEAEKKAASAARTELEGNLKQARETLQGHDTELKKAQDAQKARDAELASVRAELASAKTAQSELAELRKQHEAARAELEASQNKKSQLEKSLADSAAEVGKLGAVVAGLKIFESKAQAKETEVQGLIAASESARKERETDAAGHRARVAELESKLAALESEARKERETDAAGHRARVAELESKLAALESEARKEREGAAAASARDAQRNDELKSLRAAIEERDRRLTALGEESKKAAASRDSDVQKGFADRDAQIQRLSASLAAAEARWSDAAKGHSAALEEKDRRLATLSEQVKSSASGREESDRLAARAREHEAESARLRTRVAEIESALTRARHESDQQVEMARATHRAAIEEREREIARLKARVEQASRPTVHSESGAPVRTFVSVDPAPAMEARAPRIADTRPVTAPRESEARIGREAAPQRAASRDSEPPTGRVGGSRTAGHGDTKDDLKEIFGVGPKLERLLHGLGIFRFQQVSQWTNADIDRVDAQLENFKGRIRRDGWVKHATELHRKKYGA